MKHLEEEPERETAIYQTREEVIPWDYFSLSLTFAIWSGRFRFIFSARQTSAHRITRPGLGERGAIFPRDWWCVFLLRVTGYCFPEKQLRMQMTSYGAPLVLTLLRARRWCSLSFIKPLFPLPGLWRDWKGERGQRREVLIH